MRKFFYLCNLLFFLLAGCSSSSQNYLRINIGAEPQTLDPHKARDAQAQTVTQMLFEGLTRMGKNEKYELAAAQKVEISADGKTYLFYLKDTKWSTGDPVTAHDFVYAWKKTIAPHFPSDTAFQLYVIKNAKEIKSGKLPVDSLGVCALTDTVLQVELLSPVPYFLELTALPVYFPVHEKTDRAFPHWALGEEHYACNGPFVLKKWDHSYEIKVVKNPLYWDAKQVKLEGLELFMVNEEAEFKMYEKKELDWAGSPLTSIPLSALVFLKERSDLHHKPFLGTHFFRLNTEKPPFNHPLIRKAFAQAINRKEIVEHILQGAQLPATALVPATMGLRNSSYFRDGDVEKARDLLKQGLEALSLKKEDLPSITLMYLSTEKNHLLAQAVQQQWQNGLGVTVRLEPMERKTFFDCTSRLEFQVAVGSWTADFNDPINFLEVFKYRKGGSNNTAWENSQYTTLLDKAFMTVDVAERKGYLQQCEAILMEEMPIIPLYHYVQIYLSPQQIKDVVVSPLGHIDFKWASIDKQEEK